MRWTQAWGHHIALSVVGIERLPEYGYFRAKIAQERLIKGSSIPYSIIRATQFFEFIGRIADEGTEGNTVRLASALIQPMAADDVASAVAGIAVGTPVNGTVEIAGPEQFRLDGLIRQDLAALNDPREVISDPHARYFGGELSERTLVPGNDARLGETRFENWLSQAAHQIPKTGLQPAAGTSRREQLLASSKLLLVLTFLINITLILTGALMAEETITPLMSNDLAGVSGKEVLMYTVDFPPGFSSPVHRHNAQVSLYVLEGSVVMQVRGGKEVTLRPGQTFYEDPNDIHVVSRNASSTKSARFLVFLITRKALRW
jgi:quercetin dioxygenase-like cupin family protein